jgi:hypothetical protein
MHIRFLSLLTPLALLALPAQAVVLLSVDLSQTNQITISTGGGNAGATRTAVDRFQLRGLFEGNAPSVGGVFNAQPSDAHLVSVGDTAAPSGGQLRVTAGEVVAMVEFYTEGGQSSFTNGFPGFTGSTTWVVPPEIYEAALATATSGNWFDPQVFFNFGGPGNLDLIGTFNFSAIPEPRAAAFVLALGAVGLVVARRRKRVG